MCPKRVHTRLAKYIYSILLLIVLHFVMSTAFLQHTFHFWTDKVNYITDTQIADLPCKNIHDRQYFNHSAFLLTFNIQLISSNRHLFNKDDKKTRIRLHGK